MKINENTGTVIAVNKFNQTITVRNPKGGTFECKNVSFDFQVGQAVCFVPDLLGKTAINVIPKDVADVLQKISESDELKLALVERPDWTEEEELERILESYLSMEATDDGDYTYDPGSESEIEELADQWCGDIGGCPEETWE